MKNSKILTPKVVAVAYESGRLRESFFTEFIWETKREIQKVVAYGRWSLTRVVVQRELTVHRSVVYRNN